MAIGGDLKTMPLVELLQWGGGHRKTGILELERNQIRRRIAFRDGRIIGCASDDPSCLLGRFLISRGKIGRRTLQFALREQEANGRGLPDILVDMGVITKQELEAQIALKALETIHRLFEWQNATFRFEAEATPDGTFIDVDLDVDGVLLKGAEHQDELQRFRKIFPSSGIVLRRTGRALPTELECGGPSFEALELINGERTLAEILLKAHASEFDVLQVLFTLHESGSVELVEERVLEDGTRTLLDVDRDGAPAELPSLAELFADDAQPYAVEDGGAGAPEQTMQPADLHVLLHLASRKMDQSDHEGALEILDACYRARPDDDSVKKSIARAESEYLRQARCELLPPDKIPVRVVPDDLLPATDLQPTEATLLGLIDGETDVQSILWTLPLREVHGMRTLQRLYTRGLIQFEEPTADDDPTGAADQDDSEEDINLSNLAGLYESDPADDRPPGSA